MLRLDNLRKSFGAIVAVDGVSLHVAPGEVFGLLGPNGAGKTTTISMAAGLLAPDTGTVSIDGKGSPMDAEVRRNVGIAPQSIALYDQLTGDENLSFFASIYGLGGATRKARMDACLELVGLTDRRRDPVVGYSGGMKRRLNLAAALLHEPRLIFMDEPTAGVDPQSRNALIDIVKALKSRGVTIIYSTHYMEEAQKICDRVGIIDKGKVLAVGTVPELIKRHGGPSTLEIEAEGRGTQRIESHQPVQALIEASRGAGTITSATIHAPDLEGVFLSLTGRSLRD